MQPEMYRYDNSTKCYRSDTANSKTWTALAPYVRNVIKYDSSTTNLYGLHRDKVTYLVSNDYGLSWTISTQVECDSATGTKHASPPPTGTNSIASTSWSTDVDGVYYSGSLVLSWANFCF
uniref:Uncharacterized protein n=1 Tax=Plectus sambesii TaxID=2011161 RepID=A0A914V7C2_9BILA